MIMDISIIFGILFNVRLDKIILYSIPLYSARVWQSGVSISGMAIRRSSSGRWRDSRFSFATSSALLSQKIAFRKMPSLP